MPLVLALHFAWQAKSAQQNRYLEKPEILISTIENISETGKIFISTGQPKKKKSYTHKHAVVVDTSLFFCACEQPCGVLLRSEVVVELDLTSSIGPRACRLGPESFQIKACQKQKKLRRCLQDYKTFCVIALDSKRDPTHCF